MLLLPCVAVGLALFVSDSEVGYVDSITVYALGADALRRFVWRRTVMFGGGRCRDDRRWFDDNGGRDDSVFVPTDLEFLGMSAIDVAAVNPHLMPLIAHDRAGFGGGVATCGMVILFSVVCGTPSRSLWEALAVAGGVGFATAIGVHPIIGYTNAFHIAPALIGLVTFVVGMICLKGPMCDGAMRHGTQIEQSRTAAQVV